MFYIFWFFQFFLKLFWRFFSSGANIFQIPIITHRYWLYDITFIVRGEYYFHKMDGILAHFHVQLISKKKKIMFWMILIFGYFFFSWKYNPIFLFSIATRPGEQWYRYCVDTWLQEFIGFFFLFWGGRLCFLSLFTAAVCLHFFFREIN